MVLEAVACKHCGQTQQVKPHRRTGYGTTRGGTQRYRCFDCGRTAPADRFVKIYTHKARDLLVKAQITQLGPTYRNGKIMPLSQRKFARL